MSLYRKPNPYKTCTYPSPTCECDECMVIKAERKQTISAFKLVEADKRNNGIRFLYHGHRNSMLIPINVWLKAGRKPVRDGADSRLYLSGFHVFLDKAVAEEYAKRFKKKKVLIVEVDCRGLRYKHGSTGVYLANEIYFGLSDILKEGVLRR